MVFKLLQHKEVRFRDCIMILCNCKFDWSDTLHTYDYDSLLYECNKLGEYETLNTKCFKEHVDEFVEVCPEHHPFWGFLAGILQVPHKTIVNYIYHGWYDIKTRTLSFVWEDKPLFLPGITRAWNMYWNKEFLKVQSFAYECGELSNRSIFDSDWNENGGILNVLLQRYSGTTREDAPKFFSGTIHI
jgi:hypothetical protein